jgi:thiol:disulfide interchange protein DsbD
MAKGKRSRVRVVAALLGAAFLSLRAAAAPDPLAVPEGARGESGFDEGEPRVEARLLALPDETGVPGDFRIGVLFDLDPGWHLYWRDPGESGLPTRLAWEVPGAIVEPVAWPVPSAFQESDGLVTTYGYDGRILLATRAIFGVGAPRERSAKLQADLLVCAVECIPASFTLERRLEPDIGSDAERALFDEAAQLVPQAPAMVGVELETRFRSGGEGAGVDLDGWLAVRACPREPRCAQLSPGTPAFFPDRSGGAELEVVAVTADGAGGFQVALRGRRTGPQTPRIDGVLALVDGDGAAQAVKVDLPIGVAATAPAASVEHALGLARALALALLGGLLLNLMPCVLPVLALKAVAVAELSHRRHEEALGHGIAYLAGVLASMAALAAVVVGLRAAGTAVGWGFQFQEPLFLAVLASVLVVFASNLFGVFEIGVDTGRLAGVGAQASGARRSFFDGLLAVVLATPCSAPFLGTAVGFAFAGGATDVFAIFLVIGAGLALPFVSIAAAPKLARWLPRSGPWMPKLRALLGFSLLATVVWLLWILGRSAGVDAMASLLVWLLALGFATWLYAALREGSRLALHAGGFAAIGLLLVAGAGVVKVERAAPEEQAAEGGYPRAYQAAAVAEQQRAGRPVFAYFTADWCLTCKLNERVVLSDAEVQRALARQGYAVFEADWTRRDESIRAELARFGRSGVPLYLLFPPEAGAPPRLLPELLSKGGFLEALHAVAQDGTRVREVTLSPAPAPIHAAIASNGAR